MRTAKTTLRYGTVAMTLHWLIAAAVITNLSIGLYMADLPNKDPGKFELVSLHKSIGLSVLALSVLRVLWRLVNPVPPPPPGLAPWIRFSGQTMHFIFYFLIVAVPLAGWLMVSVASQGHPTSVFGLFDWPSVPVLSDMTRHAGHPYHETFESIHRVLAWAFIGLVPLHVIAALYHQFVRRDGVLARMLPRIGVRGKA